MKNFGYIITEIREDDRQVINNILIEQWESTNITIRGKIVDGTKLNGFIAKTNDKIVGLVTYFSFRMNKQQQAGDQQKQMKSMTNMMVVFMAIAAFSISTGIAIYWVTTNIFTIIQNLIVKRGKKNDQSK